jgi:hypothetical protein
MIDSVLQWLPTEDQIDRQLAVASRERTLLMKLLRIAREADMMRAADAADRAALEREGFSNDG